MGIPIVTFNTLGIVLLMLVFGIDANNPEGISMLVGSSFGAILTALFAQLGGGIYTKAADIDADLVGGNTEHCAGSGADHFESGADIVVATMIVAASPIFLSKYG